MEESGLIGTGDKANRVRKSCKTCKSGSQPKKQELIHK